jgi:hypothetical protein
MYIMIFEQDLAKKKRHRSEDVPLPPRNVSSMSSFESAIIQMISPATPASNMSTSTSSSRAESGLMEYFRANYANNGLQFVIDTAGLSSTHYDVLLDAGLSVLVNLFCCKDIDGFSNEIITWGLAGINKLHCRKVYIAIRDIQNAMNNSTIIHL